MASPTFIQVDRDVDKALKSLIAEEFPGIPFSYSITPSKEVNDGGLGATWNGWWALLERLADDHLNRRPEYERFSVGAELVDHTRTKNLTSARMQLRKRLFLLVQNPD